MARILITGGTGALGSDIVKRLAHTSHTLRITSRKPRPAETRFEWAQVDFETQTDFSEAVRDVDTIVHCASSAIKNTHQSDVIGTQNLLAAAKRANVRNFLFISIVGIDRIPYSYYKHKLTIETMIKQSGVPYTINRVAQFHTFIDTLLGFERKLPVLLVPTQWQAQTIDTREVAQYLMPFIENGPTGRTDNVAGPQVMRLGEMARLWRDAQGMHKPIVRLPVPGAVSHGFGQGYNTAPDKAYGSITWADYLQEKYAQTTNKVAVAR